MHQDRACVDLCSAAGRWQSQALASSAHLAGTFLTEYKHTRAHLEFDPPKPLAGKTMVASKTNVVRRRFGHAE